MTNKYTTITVPFLAMVACLLWSTAFVGIKIGLHFTKPLSFAGMRFMLAGLLLVPFCGTIRNYLATFTTHYRLIFLLSFFQTFLLYGFFYTGMTRVSGATGAIIIGSSPLFTAVIAHHCMADDKITPSRILSIFIGIIGVSIISIHKHPWTASGLNECLGIFVLILGNIACAIGNIIVAKERKNIHPLILNSSQIFIGGCCLLLISLPVEGMPKFIQPFPFYLVLLWLAFISAASFSLWFILLKRPEVKVSQLNIWKFLIPVSGAILSWIILPEESPDSIFILGMFFVSLSVIINNLSLFSKPVIKEY